MAWAAPPAWVASKRMETNDKAASTDQDLMRTLPSMATPRPILCTIALALAGLLGLSACGSGSDEATTAGVEEEDHDHDHDEHKDDEHDEHKDDEHDHDDEGSAGLGAHEHGVAELTVAWDGGDVVVDFISPTYNIFGFEYEPESDEDIAVAEEQTAMLTAAENFAINAEAACSPNGDVTTDIEYEGSHAEITASWLFTCENPDELSQIDTAALFAKFPNLEDVDAQWASADTQSAAELVASATVLVLE